MDDKSGIVTPRLAGGLLELTPAQQRMFNRMLATIGQAYERFGYTPIATPAMELTEVLLAKGGGETAMQIYKVDEGRMALHFDLTVPLARYVAQNEKELRFPFRRWQAQPVWRAEKPQLGRFNEFWQCDFDVIGAEGVGYDAEVPVVINGVLSDLDVGEFTIRVNNRKILNGLLQSIGCAGRETEVLRIVDKLDRGDEAVLIGALENLELPVEVIDQLLAFVKYDGDEDLISFLQNQPYDAEAYRTGVDELTTVMGLVWAAGVPRERCQVDLTIARGLDYYTGTVYETKLNECPNIGSVCSGGRFDELASNYTITSLPGVGASIGLTRLFWQLDRAKRLPTMATTPAMAMVAPMGGDSLPYAMSVAHMLREQSERSVMTWMEPNIKLTKQLKYANQLGIPYVVIIGDDETRNQRLTVRDMNRGDQFAQITIAQAVQLLTTGSIV